MSQAFKLQKAIKKFIDVVNRVFMRFRAVVALRNSCRPYRFEFWNCMMIRLFAVLVFQMTVNFKYMLMCVACFSRLVRTVLDIT